MVSKLTPELNKVYFINKYTMFHLLEGSGGIQVDFKNYHDWRDKIIFLEKGQYIKFLSEDFVVRKVEFEEEEVFKSDDVRVLFKQLVSIGYINFDECEECQKYLSNTVFSDHTSEIIDISSKQWYWQNPFRATKDEYHIIFDAKDIIDQEYKNHLSNDDISKLISGRGYYAHSLMKDKVGLTIKSLMNNKRLLEGKKELSFTNKSVKEISYEIGYNDPAYFNRVFKNQLGQSPYEFRKNFEFEKRDMFVQDIYELIKSHHADERSLDFYADKMHLSIKSLSRKVKTKLHTSLGRLIRLEVINSGKTLLTNGVNINDISNQLGFEEPNHFSSFFKHNTGLTPSEYKQKKSNQ